MKKNLIKKLHDQGVSGIIIQTGYYLEEIPHEMAVQSNHYNFPILELPKTVSFSEITKVVHKHILNKQFEEIHFSEEMYRKFTDIAVNNQGLLPIAKAMGTLIKGHISIFDIHMNELCSVISSDPKLNLPDNFCREILYQYREQEDNSPLRTSAKLEFEHNSVLIVPVNSKNDIFGYIVGVKADAFNDLEEIAVQHASTISALEFIKLSSLEEKDNQLKSDFLELVLTGNYTDELTIYSKGEALGYKIGSHDTCVAIIKLDEYDQLSSKESARIDRKLQQLLMKRLQDNAFKTLFKKLNGHFVILITREASIKVNITDVLTAVQFEVQSLYDTTLSIGIGNYYNDYSEYRFSYKEAQESLFIIDSVWKNNKCIHHKDLGLYKLLLPLLQDKQLINNFHKNVLNDLINDKELLETLRVYLEDLKINESSQKLFIHRHTLKYRIKKIETITQRKISNFHDRIELELALIIHNMLDKDTDSQ